MNLTFKAGSELVRMRINRENKVVYITSRMTNYAEKKVPWKMLFDKGKERIQEKLTDKLDDAMFKKAIIMSMQQQGYILKDGKCTNR